MGYKNIFFITGLIIFIFFISMDKIYGEDNVVDINNIKYRIIEDNAKKQYGRVEVIKQNLKVQDENIISIPEKITLNNREYFVTRIGKESFKNYKKINIVYIPYTVEEIGEGAFYEADNLEEVCIEEGSNLYKIGKSAFYYCKKLKIINIPDNVKEIDDKAFNNCKDLEEVKLPEKLTVLSEEVFNGCTNLRRIDISNIKTIEKAALKDCEMLNDVTMSKNLKYIGEGAFFNCSNLKVIDIPDDVENVETGAFANCINIVKVNIPQKISQLKDSVFYGCVSLSEVEIPENIERIYIDAFSNCVNLKNIIFKGKSPPNIDESAFYGCENIIVKALENKITYKNKLENLKMFNIEELNYEIQDQVFMKETIETDKEINKHRNRKNRRREVKEQEKEINKKQSILVDKYMFNLLMLNSKSIRFFPYDLILVMPIQRIKNDIRKGCLYSSLFLSFNYFYIKISVSRTIKFAKVNILPCTKKKLSVRYD